MPPECGIPHVIPYQGSKRRLAGLIGGCVPETIDTWFEPFAGSAAMALWCARNRPPRRIVLGDSLEPLVELWRAILTRPEATARRYREVWAGQLAGDGGYFNAVRERFNEGRDPVDLLYLLCRCVKNAVRFNATGRFTQSVDRRRLGTRPDRMDAALQAGSLLLRGRTELRQGDWLSTLAEAGPDDFAYLDPPFLGTSTGRDRRYGEWMSQARLIEGLASLNARKLRFALSYDGSSGERSFGPPLPGRLRLTRLLLAAGRSGQGTLCGRDVETTESLYLSPALADQASRAALAESSIGRSEAFASNRSPAISIS